MKTSSCAPLGKHAALPLLILALLAGIWSVTFHVIGHERATAHLVANAAEASTLLLVILNPYSLWRLHWGGRVRPWSFGACRALLRDTGLDVVRHRGLGPLHPWLREGASWVVPGGQQRDPWAVWRAAYLVQARKRRRAVTPVRPMAPVAFEQGMRVG